MAANRRRVDWRRLSAIALFAGAAPLAIAAALRREWLLAVMAGVLALAAMQDVVRPDVRERIGN